MRCLAVALALLTCLGCGGQEQEQRAGGSRAAFVAVGTNGLILRSTDGLVWVAVPSGTWSNLWSVCAGPVIVAAGRDGTVLTSSDGVAWTAADTGTEGDLHDVVWDGERFLLIDDSPSGATGRVLWSRDGRTWGSFGGPQGARLRDLASGAGSTLAATDAGLFELRGEEWTPLPAPGEGEVGDVAFGAGHFAVVMSPEFPQNDEVYVSPDGREWTTIPWGPYAVVFSSGGERLIVMGDANPKAWTPKGRGSKPAGLMKVSQDGQTWNECSKKETYLYRAASHGDTVVAFGRDEWGQDAMATSHDGGATCSYTTARVPQILDVVWVPEQ